MFTFTHSCEQFLLKAGHTHMEHTLFMDSHMCIVFVSVLCSAVQTIEQLLSLCLCMQYAYFRLYRACTVPPWFNSFTFGFLISYYVISLNLQPPTYYMEFFEAKVCQVLVRHYACPRLRLCNSFQCSGFSRST